MPDLVEREGEIVFPGRRREHQPQSAAFIDGVAGVQFRRAETAQEVLELVDRLDRCRRVVDRGRQRLDCDVDKKPDRIFRVLLEGSLALKMDGPPQWVLRQRRSRIVNMQESRTLDQRIADRAGHHDRPLSLPRQRDKGIDVELGDGARFAKILHRLGHAAEPRRARRAFGTMKGGGRIVQAAEHLADDRASLIAKQVKHVADLKVAQALHQP